MPFVVPFLAAALFAEGIGTGVAVAATAVTAAVSWATVIAEITVSVAISAGAIGLSALLQTKPKLAEQKVNVRQPVAARSRSYGRVKTGGVYGFLAVRTPWLYYEILLHQGEIDGIEDYYLGEYTVELDGDGNVTSVNESATPGIYRLDDGNYIANIQTQSGTTTQAAYARLLSAFPESYTSAMQCKGIATALVSFADPGQAFANRYPSGLPMFNAAYRASKVWDPRDPSQSQSDPSTWKWTENGVLIVLDYIWHQDGMRLPFSLLAPAIPVWIEQANIADQVVPLLDGGSEPRYRLNGTYQLTDPPKKVLPLMLGPMDARLGLRSDGAIVMDVGYYMAPVDLITDAQIVGYSGFSRGKQKADIRNEFRASFTSPDYKFVEQEADPWLNEASINVDGLKTQSMDLTWAPSHRQTRVKMKIESFRQDPNGWTGQIITNSYGLKFLEPNPDGTKKRMMMFTIVELGITAQPFEVQRFKFDVKSGQCTFDVLSLPSDAYAWDPAVDEGTAPAIANAIAPDGIEDPSSLSVQVVNYQISGVITTAQLKATVPAPFQQGLTCIIEYAVHDDDIADDQKNWIDFGIVQKPFDGTPWIGETGPLPPNSYDVRTWFQNSRALESDTLYQRGFIVQYGGGGGQGAVNNLDFRQPGNSQYFCFLSGRH